MADTRDPDPLDVDAASVRPRRSSARAAIGVLALGLVGVALAWLLVTTGGSPRAAPAMSARSPTPTVSPTPGPTPSTSPTGPAWDGVVARVDDGIVHLAVQDCDGDRFDRSGFHVADGLVVTAASGLEAVSEVRIGVGGEQRSARVVGIRGDGAALLEVAPAATSHHFVFVEDPVVADADVAFLGADPRRGLVESVPTRTASGGADEVVTLGRPTDEAFAGGPVVAADGRVVGVAAPGTTVLAAPAVAEDVAAWTRRPEPRPSPCASPTPSPSPAASPGPNPFTPTPVPTPAEPTPSPEPPPPSPSPAPPPPPSPEPAPAATGPRTPSWIAILESLAVDRYSRDQAGRRAGRYARRLGEDVRVLRSDDYATLNPGYWVVWYGPFAHKAPAREACADATAAGAVCYPRRLDR